MKYNEAYNKIIEAYFKDEIKPMSPDFCFCGTLNNNCGYWLTTTGLEYSRQEFTIMEDALLTPLTPFGPKRFGDQAGQWEGGLQKHLPGYEDALFIGMANALEQLKQIHIERGEIIDPLPSFTKRELVK